MTSSTPVSFADLLVAFDWVSSGAPMESSAFVSRVTGATHLSSTTMDLEEELPEDIEDASLYVEVPHKNDLDLGRNLVLKFVDEKLPDSYSTVADFFRKRGAYARYKDLLEHEGMLEAWYEYEAQATEQALREWSEDNGLQLKP
jgi:Uncharacterised protein family (UPF0158)